MASRDNAALMKREREQSLISKPRAAATVTPPADIYETDDAYVLMLDIPGATKESISLNMDRSTLTIRGTVDSTRDEHAKVLHHEIRGGTYERVFNLTDGIDRDSVEAHYSDGVLTIKLLKKEEVKPRTIQIR